MLSMCAGSFYMSLYTPAKNEVTWEDTSPSIRSGSSGYSSSRYYGGGGYFGGK